MERKHEVGAHVILVDEFGVKHDALVTIWWGLDHTTGAPHPAYAGRELGCNVVYVSGDPQKDDTYGRQIERKTSIVHHDQQPAGGMYWKWPDE